MKLITNKSPVPYARGVQGQDFIGSVRTFVNPETIDDEHVLLVDAFFAWNTLSIQAFSSPVEVFVTISNPSELESALWHPLTESIGCPESYATNGNVAPDKTMLYAYEHPITAFKFRSSDKFRVEMCCKSPA